MLAKYATRNDIDLHENIISMGLTAIKRCCVLNFAVPLVPNLVIKLRFHPNINKNFIRLLTEYLLKALPLPSELRKEIGSKIRVVFVRMRKLEIFYVIIKSMPNRLVSRHQDVFVRPKMRNIIKFCILT